VNVATLAKTGIMAIATRKAFQSRFIFFLNMCLLELAVKQGYHTRHILGSEAG